MMRLRLGLGFGLQYKALQPPPAFSPTSIADLALWLDASDTSTITQVAGGVSQWNDKSGLGRHATQSTGAQQPSTNTRSLNSRNVLDFDGTNDNLALPSALYAVPGGDNTVLVVFATDTTSPEQRFLSASAGSTFRWGISLNTTAGNFSTISNSASAFSNRVTTFDTNAHLGLLVRNGTAQQGYYDGNPGSAAAGANLTPTSMKIGTFSTGITQPFNGVIAEIRIYTRALTNAEINLNGQDLASKWGFTWTNL